MRSEISFAGVRSSDLRVWIERYPARILPEQAVTATQVPGRNGALLMLDGNYTNYEQEYEVFISAESSGLILAARDVAIWLESPKGYQRLEDSYEPDVYRLAYYAGGKDIESILNRFGRATIAFNCKPQRFLKSGETPITLTASGTLTNGTKFDALPLIRVNGSGAGTVTVGDITVTISDIDGYVDIDCDLQDAYKGSANKNGTISLTDFPKLAPGNSSVSFSGGVTSLVITPRWWTI